MIFCNFLLFIKTKALNASFVCDVFAYSFIKCYGYVRVRTRTVSLSKSYIVIHLSSIHSLNPFKGATLLTRSLKVFGMFTL